MRYRGMLVLHTPFYVTAVDGKRRSDVAQFTLERENWIIWTILTVFRLLMTA